MAAALPAQKNAGGWGWPQAWGPVFPVSHRVPCSPVQACAFMSEEPEQALSILTWRAEAGQVRVWGGAGALAGR